MRECMEQVWHGSWHSHLVSEGLLMTLMLMSVFIIWWENFIYSLGGKKRELKALSSSSSSAIYEVK